MDNDSSLRVGIAGLGNIGHFHAERLVDRGIALAGLDVDSTARERFADRFDAPTYADLDHMLDRTDAIIVTTPNRYHEEYAVGAMEAGVDVLIEKPLAHTLASAHRIAAAAERSDAVCMVGFVNRFRAAVEVLMAQHDRGRFGEIQHIEANYVRRRGIPGRGSWFTARDVAGGGALIDIGVHAIDLAMYILDFPEVVEVAGVTRSTFGTRENYAYLEMWGEDTGPEGFDVDDFAYAFIRCADGRTISLETAWAANRPPNDAMIVHGTDAGAMLDREEEQLTIYEASTEGADHFSDEIVRARERDPFAAEQELFLAAAMEGIHPERNTVDEALAVQRIIEAIYRSSEDGRAVRLDEIAVPEAAD